MKAHDLQKAQRTAEFLALFQNEDSGIGNLARSFLALTQEPEVRVQKIVEDAPLPEYKTAGAAGMDLCAIINEPLTISPMERKLVGTGIAVAIPEGYEGQVRPRSGLAHKYGVSVANAPGTIDADYRGEIGVILINLGQTGVTVRPGDRIAQLVVTPVIRAKIRVVDELDGTDRGSGGFGSTGA